MIRFNSGVMQKRLSETIELIKECEENDEKKYSKEEKKKS